MKRLCFILCLLPLIGLGQSIKRQFFTTNTAPDVVPIAGTNAFVTFSLVGQERRYRIDVPALGAATDVWTNDGAFVWLSGLPAPDPTQTTPGPPFFHTLNGSFFAGTNVNQDATIDSDTSLQFEMLSLTSSNEPPTWDLEVAAFDSEDQNEGALFWVTGTSDPVSSSARLRFDAWSGSEDNFFYVQLDPFHKAPQIRLDTNNVSLFKVDTNGILTLGRVTANGFIDTSGAAGSLATNGWTANTDFPLGATNYYLSQGAATIGVTGLANKSTSTARSGKITILATGDIVFTNPPSFHANDFLASRTISNGNTAELAINFIPGIVTNFAIMQFR